MINSLFLFDSAIASDGWTMQGTRYYFIKTVGQKRFHDLYNIY